MPLLTWICEITAVKTRLPQKYFCISKVLGQQRAESSLSPVRQTGYKGVSSTTAEAAEDTRAMHVTLLPVCPSPPLSSTCTFSCPTTGTLSRSLCAAVAQLDLLFFQVLVLIPTPATTSCWQTCLQAHAANQTGDLIQPKIIP